MVLPSSCDELCGICSRYMGSCWFRCLHSAEPQGDQLLVGFALPQTRVNLPELGHSKQTLVPVKRCSQWQGEVLLFPFHSHVWRSNRSDINYS